MNPKASILFTTKSRSTLGNSSRLEMIKFLTNHFESTIYTNQGAFIKSFLPNNKVVELPQKKTKRIPLLSDLSLNKNWARILNEDNSKFVFMFDDTAQTVNWINKPVYLYVHQFGERSLVKNNIFRNRIKRALKIIKEYWIFNGLRKSKLVFVVSKPIIELLKKKSIKNTILVTHAIDLNKFRQPYISEFHSGLMQFKKNGFFIVTYTGWFSDSRGFNLMLESLKNSVMIDSKIVFVFAGADSSFYQKINSFSVLNNLTENIINFGQVESNLIPGILYFSDVCLSFLDDLHAFHISPPQKIIEYFGAGKPVICNKIEPHEWLVTHEKNGLLVDQNPIEVTKAIIKLKNDPLLYKKMAVNAFNTAQKYSIEDVYGKMIKLINENFAANKK